MVQLILPTLLHPQWVSLQGDGAQAEDLASEVSFMQEAMLLQSSPMAEMTEVCPHQASDNLISVNTTFRVMTFN